jgi:hypothetical protein
MPPVGIYSVKPPFKAGRQTNRRLQTEGTSKKHEHNLGPLFQIDVPDRRPGQTNMHGEIGLYFQNSAVLEPFKEAVTKARQSWLAKYRH